MKQGPTMTVFISSFFLILNKIKLFYKAHHNGPIKQVNISLKLKILRILSFGLYKDIYKLLSF